MENTKTYDWIDKIEGIKVFDWIYNEDEKKECYKRTTTENLVQVALSDWICEIPAALEVLAERELEKAIEISKTQLEEDFGDVFHAEIIEFLTKYDEAYANKFLAENPDVEAIVRKSKEAIR